MSFSSVPSAVKALFTFPVAYCKNRSLFAIIEDFMPRKILPLLLSALFVASAFAQPALPPSQDLLASSTFQPFQRTALGELRTDNGVQRAEVRTAGPWYNAQLMAMTAKSAGWKKDDVLMISFDARTLHSADESGEGYLVIAIQQPEVPHEKYFRTERSVPREWKTFRYAFSAARAMEGGNAQVILGMGLRQQTLELRNLSLKNFGPGVKLADLPVEHPSYPGREATAAWRKPAEERIEKIRKMDLALDVRDAAGKPVPNATVKIEQTRHAFGFGSCVSAQLLLGNTQDSQKYREIIARDFTRVVLENDLKWAQWNANRQRALDAIKWLNDRGIEVRGHTLVWPSERKIPDFKKYASDPAALSSYILHHIEDEVSATRGTLVQWDVINEAYNNHDAMDILGNGAMIEWFKAARAADPRPLLYINDYSILTGGGNDKDHQDHYEKTIRYLCDNGAPLDGIGFQGHFSWTLTDPAKVWSLLNRFGAFGKRLHVTELDIDTAEEAMQSDYMRDFMTICFSHPQMDGIVMWGFWEKAHWRPAAALYSADWTLRPVGAAWRDMVFSTWWTRTQTTTNPSGQTTARVFRGDYAITVTHEGKTQTFSVSARDGQSVHYQAVMKP